MKLIALTSMLFVGSSKAGVTFESGSAHSGFFVTPACIVGAGCGAFGVTFLGYLAAQEAFHANHKNDNKAPVLGTDGLCDPNCGGTVKKSQKCYGPPGYANKGLCIDGLYCYETGTARIDHASGAAFCCPFQTDASLQKAGLAGNNQGKCAPAGPGPGPGPGGPTPAPGPAPKAPTPSAPAKPTPAPAPAPDSGGWILCGNKAFVNNVQDCSGTTGERNTYAVDQICAGNWANYQCQPQNNRGLTQQQATAFCNLRNSYGVELAFGHLGVKGEVCGDCHKLRTKREDGGWNYVCHMTVGSPAGGSAEMNIQQQTLFGTGIEQKWKGGDDPRFMPGTSRLPFEYQKVSCEKCRTA